jgi:hypothetical protein
MHNKVTFSPTVSVKMAVYKEHIETVTATFSNLRQQTRPTQQNSCESYQLGCRLDNFQLKTYKHPEVTDLKSNAWFNYG